jgi:2-dehydropantoate 2-reductase
MPPLGEQYPCLEKHSNRPSFGCASGWARGCWSAVRIAVVGAGGVGGYFGGRLAAAGNDVHLVARGAHLAAMAREGLEVRSVAGDFRVRVQATDDVSEVGPVDHVLFCVKSYDTEEAAAGLGPLLAGGTAVVSLQNGVDNEERLARVLGTQHVMGGVAYIFSTIAEPGVIVHSGGPGRILFGELDGTRSDRAEALAATFRDAGVEAEATADIVRLLWDKLAFICAQAGMTAGARLSIGEIRQVPESITAFRRIVEEVRAVAAAEGVELSTDVLGRHEGFAHALEAGSTSSLHHDLTHGRRMELEALHGEVVRRGRVHGVPTPACETIYGLLRPWAIRAERAAGGEVR